MTELNIKIAAEADDGFSDSGGSFFATAGYVIWGKGDTNNYDGFMRFLNVTIPPGSTIISAILRGIAAHSIGVTVVRSNIACEDADDPAAPTTRADMEGRARTSAFTVWDNITAWTLNTTYDTPTFAAAVQEVIDRAGWASGNALQVFIDDDGSNTNARRTYWDYGGDVAKVVELRITYTAPAVAGGYAAIF